MLERRTVKKLAPAAALSVIFAHAVLYAGTPRHSSEFVLPETASVPGVPASLPAPAPGRGAVKEWTIMVFINGKNDLEKHVLRDMNEMELVGSSDKVNIVAEIGRMAGHSAADGDWTGVRRYLVRKDTDMERINSPVLADLGEADMGDYRQAVSFGRWAKTEYPARKYMFIIGNHGSGWIKSRSGADKGISYDQQSGNHMDTRQLAFTLKSIGGVDVYASDACLMQMASVAYEIGPYARYVAGSEDAEPETGYDYRALLAPIVGDPGMGPAEAGEQIVNAYGDTYMYRDAVHSLVDSSELRGFARKLDAFAAAAMASGEKSLVRDALYTAQSYEFYENKDLWDFLGLYADYSSDGEARSAAYALRDHITGRLVAYNTASGAYANTSKGLAIYMPETSLNPEYAGLSWAKDTRWDEFISWYQSKDTAQPAP